MDAIQLLKQEHNKAQAALYTIDQTATAAARADLWRQLKPELELHEQMEEACLYGPLSQEVGARDEKLIAWNDEHHSQVRAVGSLMQTLDSLGADDPRWGTTLRAVKASLESHIRKEEDEIFPRVHTIWDQQRLEQAACEMDAMKSARATDRQSEGGVITAGRSARGDQGGRGYASAGGRLTDLFDGGLDYARQQPAAALLAAAGAGMLLGMLIVVGRR